MNEMLMTQETPDNAPGPGLRDPECDVARAARTTPLGPAALPAPARTRFDRAVPWIVAIWTAVHLAFYVGLIRDIPSVWREHAQGSDFFRWQLVGFLLLWFLSARVRSPMAGRVCAGYLALSTLVLLGLSRDPAQVAGLAVFIGWGVCTANGVRLALGRIANEKLATWGVAVGATYAILLPVAFFLGILGGLSFWPVALTGAAMAAPGAAHAIRNLRRLPRAVLGRCNDLDCVELAVLEAVWLLVALGFVGASVDEVWSDAVRVHLPYVHETALQQDLTHQYACIYRLQVMGVQTCYAAFYVLGGDILVKWFSWLVVPLTALLVGEEVWGRSGSRPLALFAGAATLGCPLLLFLSTSAYIDHVLVLLCTTAFFMLLRAMSPPSLGGVMASAVVIAAVAQTKYTGLMYGALWALLLLVGLLRQLPWRQSLRWCVASGACAGLVAAPWYAYVYAGTGNPVYPFLHNWFPSPFWDGSVEIVNNVNSIFHLRPGIVSWLVFPWTATFHTGRIVEGCNGFLGFWTIALLPCLLLAFRAGRTQFLDLTAAGLLMIGMMLTTTPYARYWLPGYPALMASLTLALGCVLGRGGWKPSQGVRMACGFVLLGLLLLPLAFWLTSDSWAVFSKRLSPEERLSRHFPGYPAVLELNRRLASDEGVICTGYLGVHKVQGRAYEFFPCWNAAHHITDLPSFDAFRARHGIRYWVVDRGRADLYHAYAQLGIPQHYWTDARLVAAYSTVAIYDLQQETKTAVPVEHEVAATISPGGSPPAAPAGTAGWTDLSPSPREGVRLSDGAIEVGALGMVGHRFAVRAGSRCEVLVELQAENSGLAIVEATWLNGEEVVGHVVGYVSTGPALFSASLHAPVPPGAREGWVYVRPYDGQPVRLKHAAIKFWPASQFSEEKNHHG